MDQLSQKANVALVINKYYTDEPPDITWTRRRLQTGDAQESLINEEDDEINEPQQDLELIRELMRKLIVVKNAYLDNLCYSSLIQQKEGQRIEI